MNTIVYTIAIDGAQIPYNPTDVRLHISSRENTEFISTNASGRVVSLGGGVSPVRKTVSFTINQQPKTLKYSGPGIDAFSGRDYDVSEDYISRIQAAKDEQRPVQLEIITSLPQFGVGTDVTKDGDSIIDRLYGTYLVDDLSVALDAKSAFIKSAQVTFREYTPPVHRTGRLKGNIVKNDIWIDFIDRSKPGAQSETAQEYMAYTNGCALSWIYTMLSESLPAVETDNPFATHPPGADLLNIAYPMGTESHIGEGNLPAAPELEATETWGEMTRRYVKNSANGVVWAVSTAASTLETGIQTVMAVTTPIIRLAAPVAMAMTGNWAGLAMYALRDYPWTSNLVSNIAKEYSRSQNILEGLAGTGKAILNAAIPEWATRIKPFFSGADSNDTFTDFYMGLGYDPQTHRRYFDLKDIPLMQASFKPGARVPWYNAE